MALHYPQQVASATNVDAASFRPDYSVRWTAAIGRGIFERTVAAAAYAQVLGVMPTPLAMGEFNAQDLSRKLPLRSSSI